VTTLTLRMVKGNFVVTGPDIEPMGLLHAGMLIDRCLGGYRLGPAHPPP